MNYHLYKLPQEVALEIVCRLSHYFLQQDSVTFSTITQCLGTELLEAVSDVARIPALLRDMRPLLNELNKSNPNVFSYLAANLQVLSTL
jgi:hypothetical protein